MAGSAVVTTRLSSETMKMATPVTRNAQKLLDRPALDVPACALVISLVIFLTPSRLVSDH
jgi:hypothetical protein